MATAVAVPSFATRLNLQVTPIHQYRLCNPFPPPPTLPSPSISRAFAYQVLSDSNITPLLTMLGAAAQASRRPVWGSTLAFELWQGSRTSDLGVRVVYNGKTLRLGGECGGQYPLCEWSDWRKLLEGMIPSPTECPEFYAAWHPSGS